MSPDYEKRPRIRARRIAFARNLERQRPGKLVEQISPTRRRILLTANYRLQKFTFGFTTEGGARIWEQVGGVSPRASSQCSRPFEQSTRRAALHSKQQAVALHARVPPQARKYINFKVPSGP